MAAEKAQLTYGSTIAWSGGRNFDGFVLLLMAMPTAGGAAWTRISLKDQKPKKRVPTRVKVPIRDGVYESDTRIWRTDSLVPPSVKYASFFYDDNDRLIANGPSLFVVEADPYTLTPPTLTDPTAAIAAPAPEDVPSTQVTATVVGAPIRENVSGTKDGVNTAFTISQTGTVVLLVWNQMVLDEGIHYSISGMAITMISPALPDTGDTFEALIWG